jgi:hypothetical protein
VSKSAVASFRIGWAGMWFARTSWPYLIYLYPVFSHFPEEMHLALLREFHRLLRPGGLLIAPTRQRANATSSCGSGASGNVITVIADTGALFIAPYRLNGGAGAGGAINTNDKSV